MNKTLFLIPFSLYVFLLTGFTAFCQEPAKPEAKFNAAFVEFGGNGLLFSANYQRRFLKEIDLSARLGVGIYGQEPKHITIPIGIEYSFCIDNSHSYGGLGLGITYTTADVLLYVSVKREAGYQSKDHYFIVVPSAHYKYLAESGFLFKAALTPIITDVGLIPYIGFSFGYGF